MSVCPPCACHLWALSLLLCTVFQLVTLQGDRFLEPPVLTGRSELREGVSGHDSTILTCHTTFLLKQFTGDGFCFIRDDSTGSLLMEQRSSSNTLTLSPISLSDDGHRFFCFVCSGDDDSPVSNSIKLSVIPRQPEIIVSPTPVLDGEDMALTCHTSSPMTSANVQWYKEENTLPGVKDRVYRTIADAGDISCYKCKISANQGLNYSRLSLPVSPEISWALVKPQSAESVEEDEEMTLNCETSIRVVAKGYLWLRNGRYISEANKVIHQTTASFTTFYQCQVFHQGGTTLSPVFFPTVIPKRPIITLTPSHVAAGEYFELMCQSPSNITHGQYRWFQDGQQVTSYFKDVLWAMADFFTKPSYVCQVKQPGATTYSRLSFPFTLPDSAEIFPYYPGRL